MQTKVAAIGGGVVTLDDGTAFELKADVIEEYEIQVGDLVSKTLSRQLPDQLESVTIHQINRHKADIALVRERGKLVGRVTAGTAKTRSEEGLRPYREERLSAASGRGA